MPSQRQLFGLPPLVAKGRERNTEGKATQRTARKIRLSLPSIFRRGSLVLQKAYSGSQAELSTHIPPPQSYIGTEDDGPSLRQAIALASAPEWATFWGLLKNGLHPDRPDGFDYQSNKLGGRLNLGGAVLDFYLPIYKIGIDVQGLHFHYELGTPVQAKDALQRVRLASRGVTLIAVDEDDVLADPIGITRLALQRTDVSKAIKGY